MYIKRDLLHKELEEKANPEINFDIQRIRKEIDYFGFPTELRELLSEIEPLYTNAKTEKDFSDVAGRVRKLLDQSVVYVSDRVSQLRGKKITEKHEPRPFERRKFLLSENLISDKEKDLLDKIYGFASAEGPHSLKSSAERIRICKNIVIEVILYLLRRLHEFEEET